MNKKPQISNVKTIINTGVFNIESLDLKFSNGEKRTYQRINHKESRGAVLIVPIIDDEVLMIYEYSGGTERYELTLPKGKIDSNEDILEAANRELQEEISFAARRLKFIKTMTLSPSYQSSKTHIVLAQDLYFSKKSGDEPEPLVVVKYKLDNLDKLIYREDLTESRTIAALCMIKKIIV